MDRSRFPADPWRLVECVPESHDLGVTETLFAVGNGYLGMRGNPEEGREAHTHGTFINGFHETWPIHHAESAFGFARTGQTIVNVPDAKLLKVYIDDEPLIIGSADLESYERHLDFRDGVLRRTLVWRTPAGKRVKVESTRMVSMTQRHLAVMTLEVTVLNADAPVVISSQILNRQDGRDEYHDSAASMGEGADPRKAAQFDHRVLVPQMSYSRKDQMALGYRCARSGMTIAIAARHALSTEDESETVHRHEDDLAKTVFRVEAKQGHPVRVEKWAAYHTSRSVPIRELSDRCDRTLERASGHDVDYYLTEQQQWYADFWASCDIEIDSAGDGHPEPGTGAGADTSAELLATQQAVRYNLFCLAQATARADQQGIPAKGVTGTGYEGHYFWDTEIYVTPFLSYTQPDLARNTLHFRRRMLPAAQARAREMAQRGALFPWRTINGEEASAYYAAGTAQMHIDADVVYALAKYVLATGDVGFLLRDGVDIMVETARTWADLGFWRSRRIRDAPTAAAAQGGDGGLLADGVERSFHIHGVTGPDEYTTVVNNNLFTNVMARFNLEQAAEAVEWIREQHPEEFPRLQHRLRLQPGEVEEWRDAAAGMHIPYDEGLGIHPQDDSFLEREVWDLSRTPAELRPLMLHFHPLVIYRFQVLKQADVVLALFLQGDRFTMEQKKADFEYYDPITTGDSTLSAVVQSIIAAEVGYHTDALDYFHEALYVDLCDLHSNAVDGIHVASSGGIWSALTYGFGGMRDHNGALSFDPRLPDNWPSLTLRIGWHGARLHVHLTRDELVVTLTGWTDRRPDPELGPAQEAEDEVAFSVRGQACVVRLGEPVTVALADQGPRIDEPVGDSPLIGGQRADGTRITADVPDATIPAEEDLIAREPFDGMDFGGAFPQVTQP